MLTWHARCTLYSAFSIVDLREKKTLTHAFITKKLQHNATAFAFNKPFTLRAPFPNLEGNIKIPKKKKKYPFLRLH